MKTDPSALVRNWPEARNSNGPCPQLAIAVSYWIVETPPEVLTVQLDKMTLTEWQTSPAATEWA